MEPKINMKKKRKYFTPQIKIKKIKVNFFLSKFYWIDQFNLIGDVYAQSGGCANVDSGGGGQGTGGPESGGTGGGECSTGSTC